jgi:hypothetical protein
MSYIMCSIHSVRQGGKGAAWLVAIGAVVAYTYYENRDNGRIFSKDEQQKWNTKEETKKTPEEKK